MASDTTRQIGGVLLRPDATPFANASLTIYRDKREVVPQGDSAIVDEVLRTVTGPGGEVSIALVPGKYLGQIRLSDADRYFEFSVPETAGPFLIADLIGASAVNGAMYLTLQDLVLSARAWAENPEDDDVVPGSYSALHWAAKSSASADAAAQSATEAATFEPSNYVTMVAKMRERVSLFDNMTAALSEAIANEEVTDADATEVTNAINNLLDDVGTIHQGRILAPEGLYPVGASLLLKSNTELYGGRKAVFRAKDLLDTLIFTNASGSTGSESDICLRGFSIDGNKAGQTALAEVSGVKLLKVPRAHLIGLHIFDTEGHSIHLNNAGATVEGQLIERCDIERPGSSELGTFGSCLAITDGYFIRLLGNRTVDSAKAGIRCSGVGFEINGHIALRNGNGGLVPVSGEFSGSVINGGLWADSGPHANNDGMRLVAVERITINSPIIRGNAGAGIHFLNGSKDCTVNGGVIYNNGQNPDAITELDARDGITIKDNGNPNEGIAVNGVRCLDTQGTKTQQYGIGIYDGSNHVTVTGGDLRGNLNGALSITATGSDITVDDKVKGLSTRVRDTAVATVTGTTGETSLGSFTINGGEVVPGGRLVLEFAGTIGVSGTNTKTMRLKLGAQGFTVGSDPSQGPWSLRVRIDFVSTTEQRVTAEHSRGATYQVTTTMAGTRDFGSDVLVDLTVQLADGADNVTLESMSCRRDD